MGPSPPRTGAGLVHTGSGTLDGTHVSGNIDATAASAALTIQNGLTLNGVASIGGAASASSVNFNGDQTIDGTGNILFGAGANTATIGNSANNYAGATLTLGAGIKLDGASATISDINQYNYYFYPASLVNLGAIAADGGGTIALQHLTSLSNQGSLQASNGGTLQISGLTGNLGNATITDPNSALAIDGSGYVVDHSFANITNGESLTLTGTFSTAPNVTLKATNNSTLTLGTPGDADQGLDRRQRGQRCQRRQ